MTGIFSFTPLSGLEVENMNDFSIRNFTVNQRRSTIWTLLYIFGIKTKFYQNESPNSLYLGPLLGAHGVGNGFRPLIGATGGFDHFSRLLFLKERIELRMGIELQAGLDTEGEGFAGIGVSIGFG